MCRVIINENPSCGCRWLQIYRQCRPNAGFSQCEEFGNRKVAYKPPKEYESLQCPVHDLHEYYDRNYVRMVIKETNKVRIGSGPGKNHPGFDVPCVVM